MPRNANQSKIDNYSLNFDGNDAIEIPQTTATDITGSNTIATWVKRSTSGSNQNLVNKRGTGGTQYAFFIETTNLLGFDDGTGAKAYGNTVIPTDVWTHVAVVIESGGCTFYVNGMSDGGASSGILVGANTHTTYIGKKYSNTFYLNGKLSQVCFFDYALSQDQVTTLWGGGTSVSNPMALPRTPIAYYPLGGSAGGFVGGSGTWLTENNAIGDYVFDYDGVGAVTTPSVNLGKRNTISLWIKKDAISDQYWFASGTGNLDYLINAYVNSGNNAGFFIRPSVGGSQVLASNSDVITALNNTDTRFVNWTFVRDSDTTMRIFADGVFLESITGANWASYDTLTVLQRVGNYDINGKVSNITLFDTNLSDPEVATLYNYGSPIQTLANIPQNSNLKAWYKLDASEIYNSSSTGWEVNNALSPWTSSLNFDRATAANISLGSSSSIRPTGDYTFSIWYNLSSSVNAGVWCASTNINTSGLALFKGNSGGLELYHKGTSSTSAYVSLGMASGTLNIWQNAIFTYDDSIREIKGYLNGNLISTVSVAGTGSVSWANDFYLGRLIQGGNYYLDGRLSNFQIFNTVLPTTGSNSVETLYNNGNPLTDMSSFSSLVSWWKLDNTTTGIEDAKGSNDGTNNGATEEPGSISTLNGQSSGMNESNLVQSDLQTVAPYSKYAMNFDGVDDYILPGFLNSFITNDVTVSIWVNYTTLPSGFDGSFIGSQSYTSGLGMVARAGQIRFFIENYTSNYVENTVSLSINKWYHFCGTWNGSTIELFVDGVSQGTDAYSGSITTSNQLEIGRVFNNSYNIDGKLSNMAIWNTGLTPAEVREIYNEGLPSNLNTFSGTAPVSWWQLGENSSYAGGWTFADEMSTGNNGIGYGLNETSLTNGVGTTANGVSSGMSEGNLVGDAPYSTANAVSSGMAVTARGTNVP